MLKKSNKMQQYAATYLLLNYSTCFGRPSRPSSGVHKTVVAASGTGHTIWGASFFKRDQISKLSEDVLTPEHVGVILIFILHYLHLHLLV
jgi:hypothetical protein